MGMSADIEKNLGEQPISRIMAASELKPHDLVAHSDKQLTHKMVTRAMKGRQLTLLGTAYSRGEPKRYKKYQEIYIPLTYLT